MIVFIHIPKTGGNTLNRIAGSVGGHRACVVNSETDLNRKLTEFPPGNALDLSYIGGHVRFGYVMPLLSERRLPSLPRFVTLVRDPLERAFSLYLFVLRVKTAIPDLTQAVEGRDFSYFIDYAYDNASWQLRDPQAWLICGERSAQRGIETIARDFSVVGTTEAWHRFYRALNNLNALPFPEDISGFNGNVAPRADEPSAINKGNKPSNWREVIGDAPIRKLEQINQADFELYDYVARKRGGLIIKAE